MEALRFPLIPEDVPSTHGEVFTRRWVVEMILDLVGYTPDRDLASMVAVEPACGSGAFLVPMAERLVESGESYGHRPSDLHGALLGIDLLPPNAEAARTGLQKLLAQANVADKISEELTDSWVQCRDFLLDPPGAGSADFVVGNPPYIRLEDVPNARSEDYRRACLTMGGRADVYVGFYEHGLRALSNGGALGFICADRWMRNAYGSRLRAMVAESYSVETVISMTGVNAFEEEVDAYPAVTVLKRQSQRPQPLVVQGTAEFDANEASAIVELADRPRARTGRGYSAACLDGWFKGQTGWPSGSPERLALIAALEKRHGSLEDVGTGTKVGIGVATGADKIFIVADPDIVETDRLLPLAMAKDISTGEVKWSGKYLVNPWDTNGLVDLRDWPQMAKYLAEYEDVLNKRHTARRGSWHRTIDRVIEGLAGKEKLYIPDFKERLFPALDTGSTYPHHNLYWITSKKWDPEVLGGILLSDIANLFIEAYSVRMRGGYLRFQAQYLRRIRVPDPSGLDAATRKGLVKAFGERDREAATRLSLAPYGLDRLPD